MQDSIRVQVLQTECHLYEELPDLAFSQVFAHLLLKELPQVLIFAKFHHDIQFVPRLERIIESDYMLMLQFVHE